MSRRRFIADTWTSTTANLIGDQAAHLARVLRAQPGQVYDVVAGGFLHRAEIVAVAPEAVTFTLHEQLSSDSALPLHLLIAVFKFDHLEWAIEKGTELGVAKITPILARRTEKHLAQAAEKRVERWRRIALEASKQSRRTSTPEVSNPSPLKPALTAATPIPTRILLSEVEQSTPLHIALRQHATENSCSPALQNLFDATGTLEEPVTARTPQDAATSTEAKLSGETPIFALPPREVTHALAIGPEGGWAPEELQLFADHMWQPVTLGPRILRAETAAIAAIAIAGTHLS